MFDCFATRTEHVITIWARLGKETETLFVSWWNNPVELFLSYITEMPHWNVWWRKWEVFHKSLLVLERVEGDKDKSREHVCLEMWEQKNKLGREVLIHEQCSLYSLVEAKKSLCLTFWLQYFWWQDLSEIFYNWKWFKGIYFFLSWLLERREAGRWNHLGT